MIVKDIAEYEDKDSELAKFAISQLHSKIDYLQDKISKAIEYMEHYIEVEDAPINERIKIEFEEVLNILKGYDKE